MAVKLRALGCGLTTRRGRPLSPAHLIACRRSASGGLTCSAVRDSCTASHIKPLAAGGQ